MGMGDAKDVVFAGFSIPSGITAGSNVIIKNCKIDSPGAIIGNAAVTAVYAGSDSGAVVHAAGMKFDNDQTNNRDEANTLDDYEEGTFTTGFLEFEIS